MSELDELDDMIAEAEAILEKPESEQLFPRWVTEAMLNDMRASRRRIAALFG